MAKTRSRWREAADRIVARTLAVMPPDTPLKEKRKALRAAYPWGERRMLPYRHWCAAVRAALGLPRQRDKEPATIGFCLVRRFRRDTPPTPWVEVRCGWCHNPEGGCLACVRHHVTLVTAVALPEWRAFLAAAVAGEDLGTVMNMASDWLRERGCEPLEVCGDV